MSITSSNSLINEYLERGFGTMTKREFEVMILHDLLQNELKGKSNYEISRKLGITEAKVKGLVYEVSLKYDKDEETRKQRFMQAIQKVNLFEKKDHVVFSIEDKATRSYLDALLKSKGRFSDKSFNSEIVIMRTIDFVDLLDSLFSPSEKNRIMEEAIIKIDGNEGSADKGFKDHMLDVINLTIEKGKEKVADLTVEGIVKLISKVAIAFV